MLILWPVGLSLRSPARPNAPVATILVGLAFVLRFAELGSATWTPRALTALIPWLRLYPDPGTDLFGVWQLWTSCLLHDDIWQVLLAGLGMATVGAALERQIGSGSFALFLAATVPLSPVVSVLAGVHSPAMGLIPAVVACAGALLILAPTAHLRLRLWWWAVVAMGRSTLRLALLWWVTGLILAEMLRLSARPIGSGLDSVAPGFLPLYAAGLVLCLTAGQLFGRSGLRTVAGHAP
ncbi:MAG: rhomboid family intramembrane serine protease [Planctomycetota bacterium]|jgi:membrane associated rhomboid family serine protease|nr:rhomboid family intramembrane serine protease [Planctomycetota bacterium]